MGAKPEFINTIQNLPKIISALYPVFKFAEYFTNFVFNRISTYCIGFELLEIREKFTVYKICQIITGKSNMEVKFTIFVPFGTAQGKFRASPFLPSVFRTDYRIVCFT